jgi:Flp pilus assembly pilin Flp
MRTRKTSPLGVAPDLIARIQREEGQTMAEYAILVTVIAIVVLAAAVFLGNSISSIFSSLAGLI